MRENIPIKVLQLASVGLLQSQLEAPSAKNKALLRFKVREVRWKVCRQLRGLPGAPKGMSTLRLMGAKTKTTASKKNPPKLPPQSENPHEASDKSEDDDRDQSRV